MNRHMGNYVAFETKENAETFVKGNVGTISTAEWYVPREIYTLHLLMYLLTLAAVIRSQGLSNGSANDS